MGKAVNVIYNKSYFQREVVPIDLTDIDELAELSLRLPFMDIADVNEEQARIITLDFFFNKNKEHELKETYDIIKESFQGKFILEKKIELCLLRDDERKKKCMDEYDMMIEVFNSANKQVDLPKRK